MVFEQCISISLIIVNLISIVICLYQYVKRPCKTFAFAVVFFLANFLSNYYWGIYLFVMDDYPNVSSFFAYFGWNFAFLVLPAMLHSLHHYGDVKFFSWISLIPIPINIIQLLLYIKYGGIFNNVWQVFFTTVASCMCLNSIVFYVKHRSTGVRLPYVSVIVLLYIFFEYAMWTSSCFSWRSEVINPYNYASIFDIICYFLLPFAIIKYYSIDGDNNSVEYVSKISGYLYTALVLVICFSGYFLAVWMRNTLSSSIDLLDEQSDPYKIIAVILFIIALFIVLFSVAVIFVVRVMQKSDESKRAVMEKTVAERASHAKSDFLANMSHEIRTPINAVLGMNEMILQDSLRFRDVSHLDESEAKSAFRDICRYSGDIDSAGKSLLSIINDILDFSKIEAGRMEVVNADYKLSQVLNDVYNIISFRALAKDLKFDIKIGKSVPDGLYGDSVRIRQVLINLLNNSVKYTKRGSVILSVNAYIRDVSEDNEIWDMIFSIEDTGIGIKQEDIDKLFDKFERVDLANNSSVEGTGLGLVIVKNLLDMMNGNVSVQSTYGQGSVFTVVLPQVVKSKELVGDFRAKSEQSIDSLKSKAEILYAPDAHILVVDDTHVNLTVVKGLLKNTGINIDTVDNGDDAIRMSEKNKYDIILMDSRMPVMDGTTAMNLIKSDEGNPNVNVPFICLTADAVDGARERYIADGFTDYLVKPMNSDALKSMLMRYLEKERV